MLENLSEEALAQLREEGRIFAPTRKKLSIEPL